MVWKSKPGRAEGLRAAQSVLESGGWLTLWSEGYGSGKSYLGTAIVNESLRAGRSAAFWLMTDLLDELKQSWDQSEKIELDNNPFEYALAVDVLVIDEVEKIQFTPWSESRLERLFLHRYRTVANSVTVWLTNIHPFVGNPAARPGLDPLFSRMSQFPMIEMSDLDIRPTIAEARRTEFERGHAVVIETP